MRINALLYNIGSQSRRNRTLGGDFEGQGGEQNKGVNKWENQHKGNENAKPLPLIDHWVNFGCDLDALEAKKPLVDL